MVSFTNRSRNGRCLQENALFIKMPFGARKGWGLCLLCSHRRRRSPLCQFLDSHRRPSSLRRDRRPILPRGVRKRNNLRAMMAFFSGSTRAGMSSMMQATLSQCLNLRVSFSPILLPPSTFPTPLSLFLFLSILPTPPHLTPRPHPLFPDTPPRPPPSRPRPPRPRPPPS